MQAAEATGYGPNCNVRKTVLDNFQVHFDNRNCILGFAGEEYERSQKESLGGQGQDRFHSSARRSFYQERVYHRAKACVEKGFAERSEFGYADAHVLH